MTFGGGGVDECRDNCEYMKIYNDKDERLLIQVMASR